MANLGSISVVRPGRRWAPADILLAGLVVAVVGLMVIPLPTWLLDLLLAANLAFSISVLLVTLYVSDALKIAAFPSVLLLSTLVRLALNVSSTRLILLQADAGEVIRAFGSFVVRGNYVVGAVIFLILAVIQFVVIAKGSERVAEVGARFSLDALPGKQMAIDAELRAGSIDPLEAQRRRRALERENQFYGAMDGAVRFVKGDVIASFIITAVNLVGGLVIGMGDRGMGLEAALRRYGLLTIGDGLVTQIPALLIATGAGILVTRVASEDTGTALGEELGTQLFGVPRALTTAGVFVALLAIVPGLPTIPFLAIGFGLVLAPRLRAHFGRSGADSNARQDVPPGSSAAPFVPLVAPWSVEVSTDLSALLADDRREGRAALPARMEALRAGAFHDLGVPLPPCRVTADPALPERHVVLCIQEVPARVLSFPSPMALTKVSSDVEASVYEVMIGRAADFIGVAETQLLVDQLEPHAPATVKTAIPGSVSVPALANVLRHLVEERVSVRDLKAVLEALIRYSGPSNDAPLMAEHVRSELRRPLTYALTAGGSELEVYLLHDMIEETIRRAISKPAGGAFLALAPGAARDIVESIHAGLAGHDRSRPAVIVTQPDIRRFVRQLLATDLPDVRVVSHAELLPELGVKPIATLALTVQTD